MKKIRTSIVAVAMCLLPVAAMANECAIEVKQAEESVRERYIAGMTGLASNNYSTRPGTYSSMACLDKFMQGNMDIFFRPPDLNDLLQQALSFACEQATQAIGDVMGGGTGGAGGGEVMAVLQSLSGGLSVPSTGPGGTSLSGFMNIPQISSGGSSMLGGLFNAK